MVKIGFTGDFCPQARIENKVKNAELEESFSQVKSFFDQNQLNILNLECPLTTSNDKIEKTGPHLKALPQNVEVLNYLGCKLVATANNHFKDYGFTGMKQTYDVLSACGIDYIGSGKNFEEASLPKLLKLNEMTIAFINAADREWSTTDDNNPGCNPLDPVNVYNTIQSVKHLVDIIIVIAHGGHEHYSLPSPRIKKMYRFFIDSGANAVIGHHTHIISAYEVYKDCPIFYSLGNFCFDWEGKRDQHWNYGMLVRLIIEKNRKIGFETFYVEQNNLNAEIKFVDMSKEKHLKEQQQLLNEIVLDDTQLKEEFDKYATSLKPLMNIWIEPYTGELLPRLFNIGLLPSLMSKKKKKLLTVLMQCDSHRDILLNAIHPKNK